MSLQEYADPTTRFGLELQAGRFTMWVAALVGWEATEWRKSALDQIDASSVQHNLSPREREAVTDILDEDWARAWEIAAPHYQFPIYLLD